MGKLVLIFGLILVAVHVLAIGGFLGYGLATGRMDEEKLAQYIATWKGEKLVPYVEPAEVAKGEPETPQAAKARISSVQEEREFFSRALQRQIQVLNNMKVSISAAQAKLDKDLSQLQVKRQEFDNMLAQQNAEAKEKGFIMALKSYSAMNPKLVKDDFMAMDEKEAVRYLATMKPGTVTEILSKFKTSDEQAKRRRLVELLEEYGQLKLSKAD
jgi:flagellar motility protein MotE (MotC chaperone)